MCLTYICVLMAGLCGKSPPPICANCGGFGKNTCRRVSFEVLTAPKHLFVAAHGANVQRKGYTLYYIICYIYIYIMVVSFSFLRRIP